LGDGNPAAGEALASEVGGRFGVVRVFVAQVTGACASSRVMIERVPLSTNAT
jgi:hypothetical protein